MKFQLSVVVLLMCLYSVVCKPLPSPSETAVAPETHTDPTKGGALPRLEVVEIMEKSGTESQAMPPVDKLLVPFPEENQFIKFPIHVQVDLDLAKEGLSA